MHCVSAPFVVSSSVFVVVVIVVGLLPYSLYPVDCFLLVLVVFCPGLLSHVCDLIIIMFLFWC